jgi:organic hydroperoxide reductase OsmC/OhrA
MANTHRYEIQLKWTGNVGQGTAGYRAYSRNHEIDALGKAAPLLGSSDPGFRGDGTRYNPEELLVSTLSSCHMLWMLHLCADRGIVVTSYTDQASGTMAENEDGSGEFVEVTLRPRMQITDASRIAEAMELHHKAHRLCFIARSVKFPVRHEPIIQAESA